MSLVSYANSDDSGDEDISEPEIRKNVEKNEDKAVTIDKTGLQTKATVQTKTQQSHTDNDGSKTTKPKSIGSLFSSLPAPWMSTVTWANKSSNKKSQKNEKQPTIKITMPSLDDSDSDDEDYVKKTVTRSSEKPSGLFSLLPKPKHSVVVKENNPNRPVAKISNRPLIPDSLRRKQAKKPTPQVKKPSAKDEGSDDGSDDDDGGGSFFSWNEPTSLASDTLSSQSASDAASTVVAGPVAEPSIAANQTKNNKKVLPSMKITNDAKVPVTQETKNTENIRTFSQASAVPTIDSFNNHNIYTHAQETYQGTNNLGEYSGSYPTNSENVADAEQNLPYYDYYNSEQYNQAMPEQNYQSWQMPAQPSNQGTTEQFKKLVGKRGRGEENVDIIDVNADDQVGSSQEWKTNYQKEDADYKPQSKKKGNLPSSQQRLKHQITYLAFQAKEKEWELRNQWSANRQTRRQTQSKYGF